MHSNSFRKFTLLVGGLALVLAGCSQQTVDRNSGARPSIASQSSGTRRPLFDGKTAFEGVFFGKGPVAEHLPGIWQSAKVRSLHAKISPEARARADDLQRSLIANIEAQDPGFFTRFAKLVQSGDPVAVSDAIIEGGDRIEQALQQGGVPVQLVNKRDLASTLGTVNYTVNTNYQVNVSAVVAVIFVFGLFFVIIVVPAGGVDPSGNLSRSALSEDLTVQYIADQLYVPGIAP